VLIPSEDSVLERNRTRKCWAKTTPEYWVKKFCDDLNAGDEEFRTLLYDSSAELPEEIAGTLWEKPSSESAY